LLAPLTKGGARNGPPHSPASDFVAYVDALGRLDGNGRLLEWKITSSRYSEPFWLLILNWFATPGSMVEEV
jgi:hypothetical protein